MTRTGLALAACGLISCASDNSFNSGDSASTGGYGWADSDSDTEADADTEGGTDNDDGLGSEVEDDFLKLEPATISGYVFVANATRNTLTRIAVPSLDVLTTDVGVDPASVQTTPDQTVAVVFNQGSDSLSLVDTETLEGVEVDIRKNLNALVISPDGRWAIVYHDHDVVMEDDDVDGIQSHAEVSLVDLYEARHVPVVVGFRPHEVRFDPEGKLAAVVSDAYLALLDLTVDSPSPTLIEVAEDPLNPPAAEEVLINGDGSLAFVRQYATDVLVVVDLVTGDVERLPAGSNPTDADLTPDGSQVVVVARASNELVLYDAYNPQVPPTSLPLPDGEISGSLQFAPGGAQGVLYTTVVSAQTGRYTVWDLDDDSFSVKGLKKPISSISVTPTGTSLLAFHPSWDLDDADPQGAAYGKHGASLVDLDDFRSNQLILPAEPTAYANADSGEVGYLLLDGVDSLSMLLYEQLLYEEVLLKSTPVHVGVLPGSNQAFVNQEHELGRLTFFDPVDPLDDTDDVLETITGFELNSGIEH
jgi:DNA-binding beta-propeller fold protein YncE